MKSCIIYEAMGWLC